MFSYNLIVG